MEIMPILLSPHTIQSSRVRLWVTDTVQVWSSFCNCQGSLTVCSTQFILRHQPLLFCCASFVKDRLFLKKKGSLIRNTITYGWQWQWLMSKQYLCTRHCLDFESATRGTSSAATQVSKCMLHCFYKTNLGWNDLTFWVAQSFNFLSETRVVEGFLSISFSPGSASLPHSGPKPSSV